jgi:hypothetical protein
MTFPIWGICLAGPAKTRHSASIRRGAGWCARSLRRRQWRRSFRAGRQDAEDRRMRASAIAECEGDLCRLRNGSSGHRLLSGQAATERSGAGAGHGGFLAISGADGEGREGDGIGAGEGLRANRGARCLLRSSGCNFQRGPRSTARLPTIRMPRPCLRLQIDWTS